MYTTKDSATVSGVEPTPCDTFTYGEHPIVVIEGFAQVSEASLEILTNGTVIHRRTIPLNSGPAPESYFSSDTTYSGLSGQYVNQDRMHVVVNAGAKIDFGAIPAGIYDLNLKTNDVVAAVARFTVVLPAWLQTQREEIESERLKLQQLEDQLKQLKAELDRERATVEPSNPATVAAYQEKVAHFNQLVEQGKAAEEQFNKKIELYNDGLKAQQLGLPRQPRL